MLIRNSRICRAMSCFPALTSVLGASLLTFSTLGISGIAIAQADPANKSCSASLEDIRRKFMLSVDERIALLSKPSVSRGYAYATDKIAIAGEYYLLYLYAYKNCRQVRPSVLTPASLEKLSQSKGFTHEVAWNTISSAFAGCALPQSTKAVLVQIFAERLVERLKIGSFNQSISSACESCAVSDADSGCVSCGQEFSAKSVQLMTGSPPAT